MPGDPKIDISEKLMPMINKGEIKMRPKWYFLLGSLAMVIGIAGLTILSVFLVSLVTFSLRTHGQMGAVRFQELLSSFPLGAVILSVAGVGLGVWLLKKYDFSYKKNFLLIVLGFISAVILAGWLINYTGLDSHWMKRGPMRGLYQKYERGSVMEMRDQIQGGFHKHYYKLQAHR